MYIVDDDDEFIEIACILFSFDALPLIVHFAQYTSKTISWKRVDYFLGTVFLSVDTVYTHLRVPYLFTKNAPIFTCGSFIRNHSYYFLHFRIGKKSVHYFVIIEE